MHRFFADIEKNEVHLTEVDAFHLLGVLRVEQNEHIEVVFNDELFECVVTRLVPLKIEVLNRIQNVHETPVKITLFMCLTKSDKPETVIERAVELGVEEIVIVASDRSIVKWNEDQIANRLLRYHRISQSAAAQSKRLTIPEITYLPFKSIFNYKQYNYFFIGDANDKAEKVNNSFPNFRKGEQIAILIGPEGGFSQREMEKAVENELIPITFSTNVLRAEVAAVTSVGIINYLSLQLK